MVAKGMQGFQGNGINRLRTDQGLYIFHVTVFRIFRAGARPEQPLGMSALL